MEKAGVGDRKILFWDHNKERVVDRALEPDLAVVGSHAAAARA